MTRYVFASVAFSQLAGSVHTIDQAARLLAADHYAMEALQGLASNCSAVCRFAKLPVAKVLTHLSFKLAALAPNIVSFHKVAPPLLLQQVTMGEGKEKEHPSYKEVFAAHREVGWTITKKKRQSNPDRRARIKVSPPEAFQRCEAQEEKLQREMQSLGLTTTTEDCKLWIEISVSQNLSAAAYHCLWVTMGAVSAARLAASVLCEKRKAYLQS